MWMLLHGFLGHSRSWGDIARCLDSAVCPTLCGHEGVDEPRVDVHSWQLEVQRLVAFASTMPAPRRLCGYSMGARLAVSMVAQDPDLWSDVVLISGRAGIEDPQLRAARLADDMHNAASLRALGIEAFVEEWESRPLFRTQQALQESVLGWQRSIRLNHRAESMADALVALSVGSMPDEWGSIDGWGARTHVVAGADDLEYVKFANRMAGLARNSSVRIVDGAGHNLVLERPELVLELLRAVERDSSC